MQRKNGMGTGDTSNARQSDASCDDDSTEHRWKHLFETVEWLEGSVAEPSASSERTGPRLQAVVIDLGPPSPRALHKLREFRSFFPHVAVLTPRAADLGDGKLHGIVSAFASSRGLSPRQRRILELHLSGKHDKEIASDLGCEQTTIYEHWRRMARKARCSRKSDLVAEFHQYLASTSEPKLKARESTESNGSGETSESSVLCEHVQ